jgi:mono/diheme cytochrome c family protein
MARLLRQTTYVNFGVEKDYEGARSPLTGKPEAIADGAKLYAQNCAACHGPNGLGKVIWVKPSRPHRLCSPT